MRTFIICLVSLLYFSNAQAQTERLPFLNIPIKVQADLVSIDGNGCFTVNIRVYVIQDDNQLLIASGNSQICEGRSAQMGLAVSPNSDCGNEVYKGDFISHANSRGFKYCLIECLRDENIYNQ